MKNSLDPKTSLTPRAGSFARAVAPFTTFHPTKRSRVRRFAVVALICSIALLTGSCGKQDNGSADLDMGLSSNGLILPVDDQSCVDVASVTTPPTYSLTAPVLSFGGFSLLWKSTTMNLRIGLIRITVKSPKLSGGKFVGVMDSAEIEALLGATNGTLKKADTASGRLYSSSNSATVKEPKSDGSPARPCAFRIGGLTLANPNDTSSVSYTAQVTVELIATAFNPDEPGSESVVRKTVTGTATAY